MTKSSTKSAIYLTGGLLSLAGFGLLSEPVQADPSCEGCGGDTITPHADPLKQQRPTQTGLPEAPTSPRLSASLVGGTSPAAPAAPGTATAAPAPDSLPLNATPSMAPATVAVANPQPRFTPVPELQPTLPPAAGEARSTATPNPPNATPPAATAPETATTTPAIAPDSSPQPAAALASREIPATDSSGPASATAAPVALAAPETTPAVEVSPPETTPPPELAAVSAPQPATPTTRAAELTLNHSADALLAAPTETSGEQAVAQSNASTNPEQIRQDMQVEPLTTRSTQARSYPPSPNAGIPSGFGADWGDAFASLTLSGADRLRPEADGSLSVGTGFGDAQSSVGVEVAYNVLSLRNLGDNGSFDVKVHREILSNDRTQVSAAVGWNNIVNHGSDVAGTESSPYGIATAAHLLRPDSDTNRMPLTASLGVGGGNFSGENSDLGVIAGVGLQVDRRVSLNAAWSGRGLNVGASFVPVPSIPLTVNAIYGDVTNNTAAGSVAVLSVGYGFNFGPRF